MDKSTDTSNQNEKTGSQSFQQLNALLKKGYSIAEAASQAAKGLIPSTISPIDNRILAILPLHQAKRQKQSLIVSDGCVKLILESPKNCLDKLLFYQLGVKEPQAFFASFRNFIGNCRYKLPCATVNFTLFSIESVENGAWLNISTIKDIQYQEKGAQIQLLDGSILPIFTCKRSLSNQLKLAYQCAFIIKLNFSILLQITDVPSINELLNVPVNDFNKKILDDIGNTDWPRSWEFSQCYQENVFSARLKKER
ncbi:hypothetical protein ACYSNU_01505 [Enterococcus sp. LJL120]